MKKTEKLSWAYDNPNITQNKQFLTICEESIEKFILNITKTFEGIAIAVKIHVAYKTAKKI